VMVVDKNMDKIELCSNKFTHAVTANCMNPETLKTFDVASFDACIVAIGDDFQSSLEITSLLKELGAKYVISKASTEIQKKFLLKNGADEVVYPDQDTAEKLAVMVNSKKIFDYFAINDTHSIFEIDVPSDWIGKNIIDLNIRKKYHINVLMVNRNEDIISSINADFTFASGDHVVIFGETEKLMDYTNKKIK
ncbi:MAG: TrkA family potassium uptake protein, partial [Clostridia bacterium]|nr:TrkA family potassium uptake protein [Clostridia bacterium]